MGYCTKIDSEVFLPEYMDMFEFIFPEMMLLINISYNNSIMGPDAHVQSYE